MKPHSEACCEKELQGKKKKKNLMHLNVGSFDKNDVKVGTGLVGAPACGDVMKLQIKVNDDGVIENAVFKVFYNNI